MVLIQWYNLYHRRYLPKVEVDIQDLTTVTAQWVKGVNIFSIVYTFLIYCLFTYCAYYRYLEQCQILFPYANGHGNLITATGKNDNIGHTAGDVARYCDAINVSCHAP